MSTNLIFVVLIVAVVAMVVGPLMMMQPTSLQRRQEQLRTRATQLGLRVKITSLPRQTTDIDTPDAIPMYYLPQEQEQRRTQANWLLLRGAYAHETNFIEQWMWFGSGRADIREQVWLRKALTQLPESIAAVGKNPEGICIYWTEAGGVPTLERIAQWLTEFVGGG